MSNTGTTVKPVIVFKNSAHLVDLIKGFKGYSMATLDLTTVSKTTVKSRKNKDIKYPDVFEGDLFCSKHQYISIGYDYNKSLNSKVDKAELNDNNFDLKEQKAAMGTIETGPLPWGQWLEGSKIIIEHKGNFYLRITYLNANQQYSEKIFHYENGDEIDDASKLHLDDFLPVKKDTVLLVNSVKVAGIIRIVFDGKIYVRKGFLDEMDKTKLNTWRQEVARNDDEAIATEVA